MDNAANALSPPAAFATNLLIKTTKSAKPNSVSPVMTPRQVIPIRIGPSC